MKLPNWAKIVWWVLLTGGLTTVLYFRSQAILDGHATPFDLIAFVIWVALLLLPLFAEISLWGVTLKAHIDDAKKEIKAELASIQNEIRNEVRTTISPTFYPPAPPDTQLPKIKELVGEAIHDALKVSGVPAQPAPTVEAIEDSIDENVELLLITRYRIERELRRIAAKHGVADEVKGKPLYMLQKALVREELLDPQLSNAVREVYSICSPAVHGEDVSDAQVAFVRDVAPQLLSALSAIR